MQNVCVIKDATRTGSFNGFHRSNRAIFGMSWCIIFSRPSINNITAFCNTGKSSRERERDCKLQVDRKPESLYSLFLHTQKSVYCCYNCICFKKGLTAVRNCCRPLGELEHNHESITARNMSTKDCRYHSV
jgi:hypothetical protein